MLNSLDQQARVATIYMCSICKKENADHISIFSRKKGETEFYNPWTEWNNKSIYAIYSCFLIGCIKNTQLSKSSIDWVYIHFDQEDINNEPTKQQRKTSVAQGRQVLVWQ